MWLVWLVCLVSASAGQVSFQVHSYDDLGAWEALMNRGIAYFKLDLAFVSEANCQRLQHPYNCTGGIFLLSHDEPLMHASVRFFTADDFVKLCASTLSNVTVALCGKAGASECDPAYLKLADALFARLMRLQAARGLTFILDGSFASPDAACLAHRWLPWAMTWQGKPVEAFLSNSCQNNDTWCRFQVFDTAIADHPDITFWPFALLRFGKFALQSAYPLLVWEPSDQDIIRATAKIYTHASKLVPQGLRFAINISPERFSVFAAEYTGTAWNYQIPATRNLTNPRAFAVASSNNKIALFGWNETSGSAIFQWLAFDQWYGNVKPASSFVPIHGLKQLVSTQLLNASTALLCSSSACLVYDFARQRQLTSPLSAPVGMQSFSGIWDSTSGSVVWLGRSDSCGLLVGSACLVTAGELTVISASAAFVNEREVAIAFASSELQLFFGVFALGQSTASFSPFGAGSQVSVSFSAKQNVLLISGSDAFCYNSEYMNKEVILFCSARPSSTGGVLAYWAGTVDAWRSNSDFISPCNSAFRSGSFDQGSQSAVSLDEEGRLLEVHVGASFANQYASCGLADEYDGIVMDSFAIA